MSDNTQQDVTGQASWSSSPSGIASVNGSGLVTGVAVGAATITASYSNVTGTTTIQVLASNTTATVTGRVSSAANGANIVGATVTVIGGADAGKSAVTDSQGRYTIAGVQRVSQTLRATASNFQDQTRTEPVNGDTVVNFSLTPQSGGGGGGGGGGSTSPMLAIWTSASRGWSRIDVQIDGQAVGTLTGYLSSAPGCSGSNTGVVVVPLSKGNHTLSAKADTGTTWSTTVNIGDGCQTQELTCVGGDCSGSGGGGGGGGGNNPGPVTWWGFAGTTLGCSGGYADVLIYTNGSSRQGTLSMCDAQGNVLAWATVYSENLQNGANNVLSSFDARFEVQSFMPGCYFYFDGSFHRNGNSIPFANLSSSLGPKIEANGNWRGVRSLGFNVSFGDSITFKPNAELLFCQ